MVSIIAVYTMSFFCSFIYYGIDPFRSEENLSLLLLIFWLLIWFLSCVPIIQIDKSCYSIIEYNFKQIKIICVISLFTGLIPFLEYLTRVDEIFSVGNLTQTIADIHDDNEKVLMLSPISEILASIHGFFYYITLISFVPVFTEKGSNYLAKLGVIINLANRILPSFILSSRGAIMVVIGELIVVLLLYYPTLSIEMRRIIRKASICLLLSVMAFFFVITIARQSQYEFERGDYYTLSYFITRYAGEGIVNFTINLQDLKDTIGGEECFWYAKKIFGMNPEETNRIWDWGLSDKLGVPRGIFYTYIGSFVMDIGFFFTLLFWLFISVVLKNFFKRNINKTISLSTLLVAVVYIETILLGFYMYRFLGMGSLGFRPIIFQFLLLRLLKQ